MVVAPQLPNGGVSPSSRSSAARCDGLPLRPVRRRSRRPGPHQLFALSGGSDRSTVGSCTPGGELLGARNYSRHLAARVVARDRGLRRRRRLRSRDRQQRRQPGRDHGPRRRRPTGAGSDGRRRPAGVPAQRCAISVTATARTDLVVGVHGGLKGAAQHRAPAACFDVLPGSPVAIGSGDYPPGIAVADLDRDGALRHRGV